MISSFLVTGFMFYVDSQREVTRRESSLIIPKTLLEERDYDKLSTGRTLSSGKLMEKSNSSVFTRAKGSVRKELITMMFESMLDSIVESWEVIATVKRDQGTSILPTEKRDDMDSVMPTSTYFTSTKKKVLNNPVSAKLPKTKKSRISECKMADPQNQAEPVIQTWWSLPNERAIINFKNGNIYEGSVSMKCMHGEGRFQWVDGTVYLGNFQDNEINGKGCISWKDDTWYEGDFVGNVRHGKGLYVDSRNQRSYSGGWHCGAKHGTGVIDYSSFHNTNNYEGGWISNVRHGFGSREYSADSGYRGHWDCNVREGRGLMIWPNHDIYKGKWKNGVMSGYGSYIWNARYNNTMTLPCVAGYRGFWQRGQRNGYGILNLGLGVGAHYEGEFKNNVKHGAGTVVTSDGVIKRDKNLFIDDYLAPVISEPNSVMQLKYQHIDVCSNTLGLAYHAIKALNNVNYKDVTRMEIVNKYIENNKPREAKHSICSWEEEIPTESTTVILEEYDRIKFEEHRLRKLLEYYEARLNRIYYQYSTICDKKAIHFTPVMIRLYLWQFFNDCKVHEKGLTLVEIDRMFHENPLWLSQKPHNPFEPIRLWQFLQSVISVAVKLYGKTELPCKTETILASAFSTFMEKDVLPGTARQRQREGHLVNGYGSILPLNSTYELYRTLGEPHTVRTFMCAVRSPPHYDNPQPPIVEIPDEETEIGRNGYLVFGDEMAFLPDCTDRELLLRHKKNYKADVKSRPKIKLFNFGNLSSRSIIEILSRIFPHLCCEGKIMNLDVPLTFYEFFEALVSCAEESIRVEEDKLRRREIYVTYASNSIVHMTSDSRSAKKNNITSHN